MPNKAGPKLIKGTEVVDNNWTILDKDFTGELDGTPNLVPLKYWLQNIDACKAQEDIGVWIDSDEAPEDLESSIDSLQLIAINFPKFADGRGYSFAHVLRERMGYTGELRAIGDVLQDQLFYYKRVGFDAYAIREDRDAEAALAGLTDFSETYQAAVDQKVPLFRRRA